MDLVCLQEGFSSLIKNADPQQLGPFFVWLDFKVAQFKINGTFSPEKTSKTALEKVTKNLFENESITTTATASTIMFPGTPNLESQNAAPTYMSTPIRDNKAYISHLSKSLSFSESKLSMYQLNWEALNPRLGFRNNLNPTLPLRGPLFPQLLPEILSEPLDFSKTDKRNSQHHGNAGSEEYNPTVTETNQNNFKPKEGIRSLLREVLSRPREMPLCSTPIKTPPQVKEEKVAETPSDVLVVLPEEPNPPASESRQETRHICTICQKEFNYKSSYRRHMKIHQGLYSHTCCICTRKFTRKEHFVRHKCDRRPNKPNRRSAVLDISMNSEPDSSSLVRMDELDVDSPMKADRIKLGSPQAGGQKADSSGHGRQLFPEYKAVGDLQQQDEQHKLSSQRNSPHNYHEDDLNKNLESRRKSSTPRKFVPHSSAGGVSDVEENGSNRVPKSENDSVPEEFDERLNPCQKHGGMPGSEEGVAKLPRSPRNQADGGTPLGPSNRELRGQHKSGEGQGRGHGHQDKEAGQVLEAEKRGEDGGWHTAFRVSPVQQGLFQEFQLFKAHAHSQRDLQLRLPGVQERILPEGAFPEAQVPQAWSGHPFGCHEWPKSHAFRH